MTWTEAERAEHAAQAAAAMVECACGHIRARHVGCARHVECCDEDLGGPEPRRCQCHAFVEPAPETLL